MKKITLEIEEFGKEILINVMNDAQCKEIL